MQNLSLLAHVTSDEDEAPILKTLFNLGTQGIHSVYIHLSFIYLRILCRYFASLRRRVEFRQIFLGDVEWTNYRCT